MGWSKGYYTSSGYTYGFYSQLTPLSIYWAALIKGHILPIEKFRYIDMGCGQGYNLIINAINHPNSEFVGLDLMPEHVQHATELAKQLGLRNIKFYEFDFLLNKYDDILIDQFDYVVAHGITTWVTQEVRHALSNIVNAAIKIGGVFYNSYNTPHYWQQLMSFQHLARTLSKTNSGQSALDKAVKYYEFINKLVPDFLDSNPHLREKMKTFSTASKEYLIHEFCNQNWRLVFFDEEYEINSNNKLNYLGSMNLIEEFDEHLPKELLNKISSENWLTQQTLKDTFLSKSFKQDLWIKGRPQSLSSAIINELKNLKIFPSWELPEYDPSQPIKIKSGPIEIHTKNPIAYKILSNTKGRAFDLDSFVKSNENTNELIRMISILIDSKYISIGLSNAQKTNIDQLQLLLNEIVQGKTYNFIPTGNISSAVSLDTIGLIMLATSLEVSKKTKIINSAKETLRKRENKIYKNGVEVSGDELSKYLQEFYDGKFKEIRVKLSILGTL